MFLKNDLFKADEEKFRKEMDRKKKEEEEEAENKKELKNCLKK